MHHRVGSNGTTDIHVFMKHTSPTPCKQILSTIQCTELSDALIIHNRIAFHPGLAHTDINPIVLLSFAFGEQTIMKQNRELCSESCGTIPYADHYNSQWTLY